MNCFITGTDTDCGKTFVTALLVRAARACGLDAVAAKPYCCGPRDDVEILAAAAGGVEAPDALNPVWLRHPAAPRACEILGEPPGNFTAALECVRALAVRHDHVLCEGAGGWLVPIGGGRTVADLAAELGWPVVVVARNKLGVLNHTLLTVESARRRGLALAGVILNNADGVEGPAASTNRRVLEEAMGMPVLCEVERDAVSLPLPEIFRR